jgi:hypothetical protein
MTNISFFVNEEKYRKLEHASNQLGSALELIRAIANGYGTPEGEFREGFAMPTARQACDNWLDEHGYDGSEAGRRRKKEAEAKKIDAKIAALLKEKEELLK